MSRLRRLAFTLAFVVGLTVVVRATLPATYDFDAATELEQLPDPPWTDCGGEIWAYLDHTFDLTAPACVRWNQDSFGDDQYSQAALATEAVNGVGVRLNGTDAGNDLTGYSCELGEFASSILRWDSESSSTALVTDTDIEVSDYSPGDILRLEVSGTTLHCLVNGSLILSTTSSTYTSGSAGLLVSIAGGGGMDNWEGGNLSAPPAGTGQTLGLLGVGR